MTISKERLRQTLIETLQSDSELQTRAAHMAREEATNEESKATNKYETHSQEAAYLAESQARIAAELQDSIAFYKNMQMPDFPKEQAADIGALVGLEYRGRTAWYFLAPRNGGLDIIVDGCPITLVSPTSPLGRQLVGATAGANVQIPGRSTPTSHKIVAIA